MSAEERGRPRPTRRGFLAATAGLAAAAGAGLGGAAVTEAAAAPAGRGIEPFWGKHQGGIVTPQQSHTYFAAFDLTTEKREAVVTLLRRWTAAAARLAERRARSAAGR